MSDARERVLKSIRGALNRNGPLPASVTKGLEARLKRPSANLKPKIGRKLVERFIAKVESVSGTVERVDSYSQVSAAVADHLEAHGVPPKIVVATDPALEAIGWSNRLEVEFRAAEGHDLASVTGAYAGIAESGTLVLLSSKASPTTLNFLPDDHVIVLPESSIVGHMEDVWARIRKEKLEIPRTINLITGPSKTGDIEQTIYEGAHGPRRFHVILIAG